MDRFASSLVGHPDESMIFPAQIASGFKIDVINDLDGLREVKSEWDEIVNTDNAEPWQSFSWIEAAAVAYSRTHLLRIITIRKKNRLTAIAPLVLKPSEQPLKPMQLHFLGGEELKEPNRFIACDDVSLGLLLDAIVSEPVYPIRLSRIQNDNGIAPLILDKFKKAGWITRVMHMPYPYIDLKGNIIKKSLKRDLQRAAKKTEKLGGISFKIIEGVAKGELQKYLETGFRIEASGWKGCNNTAILCNDARKKFFEHYAHSSLREGTLRLCFLMLDNEAIAVQYGIESMNAYWLLNIGYDEKFRACSPGNLLLEESIKTAVQNGLTLYNLLGKEEPWTRRWTRTTRDCFVLAAYRPNLRGAKSMLSDAFYLVQKRFKDGRKSYLKNSPIKLK